MQTYSLIRKYTPHRQSIRKAITNRRDIRHRDIEIYFNKYHTEASVNHDPKYIHANMTHTFELQILIHLLAYSKE